MMTTLLLVLGGAWAYAMVGVATYRIGMTNDDEINVVAAMFWPMSLTILLFIGLVATPWLWLDARAEARRLEVERMRGLLAEVEQELRR